MTIAPDEADLFVRTLRAEIAIDDLLDDRPEAGAADAAVSDADLWTYACRELASPANLAVERALRNDPEARHRYALLAAGRASAVSHHAAAAAEGTVTRRRLGKFVLELNDSGRFKLLTITLPDDERAQDAGNGRLQPSWLELQGEGLPIRLRLGTAVRSFITLSLDPAIVDDAEALRLVGDPNTTIMIG